MRLLRLILATGLGSGYSPLAPGTAGSALGVLLYAALMRAGGHWATAGACLAVSVVGFWAAGISEAHFGAKDAGPVVIDEIAGQLLTLLFLPPTMRMMVVGFLLFRLLDILKPFPARRLEALPGGAGIMVDDLVVAVYANLVLQIVNRAAPEWLGGV